METWPEVTSRESPSLPVRGQGAVHSLNPSTSQGKTGETHSLIAGSLALVSSSPSFATLSGPAAQPKGMWEHPALTAPVSKKPLTFTGWSDGAVVPFQVGGSDRVEGVEGQAVRAVHGAGQTVLKV